MMEKIGKYKNIAEPFHCDMNHELFMGHLGNHLLNASDFHSSERGFGMRYLQSIHKTWVLSRLVVEMTEMPAIYDEFQIETWVENAIRSFTNRNYRIEAADGHVIGYSRSIWAMIDTDSRQPVNITDIDDGAINKWIVSDKECPIDKPSRVKMSDKAEFVSEYVAKYNDCDINGHVNSVKSIEHVLDLFATSYYRTHALSRFDIAYVAESHEGDTLRFYKEKGAAEDEWMVRMTKICDGNEVECVRALMRFNKRSV